MLTFNQEILLPPQRGSFKKKKFTFFTKWMPPFEVIRDMIKFVCAYLQRAEIEQKQESYDLLYLTTLTLLIPVPALAIHLAVHRLSFFFKE